MSKNVLCRKIAAACLEQAKQSPEGKERQVLIGLATSWHERATRSQDEASDQGSASPSGARSDGSDGGTSPD